MFSNYNPNRLGKRVGDCAVRAVSKALNVDWDTAFTLMVEKAFEMADMPSSNVVWGSVLMDHGFTRHAIPNTCPDCYTVDMFCEDHPEGTYVVKSEDHVATIADGQLYDSWPSQDKVVIYYWAKEKG